MPVVRRADATTDQQAGLCRGLHTEVLCSGALAHRHVEAETGYFKPSRLHTTKINMTSLPRKILVLMALAVAGATPYAQQVPAETRGQLLYTTHCIACHTTQMHWRDDRLAYDWDSLKFQVRRWQGNSGLHWSDADIVDVARYLNGAIYQYPQTADRVSSRR